MKKLLILGFVILLASFTYAFGCNIKQTICKNNYDYDGNCCETINIVYHSCENNATDCRARIKAEEYKEDNIGLYYSLIIDSNDPTHWYNIENELEKEFIDCVNEKYTRQFWICSKDVEDRDGNIRNLYLDNNFIKEKQQEPIQPLSNENDEEEKIVYEEKGFFENIGEGISNTIQSIKEKVVYVITFKWLFNKEDKQEEILNNTKSNNTKLNNTNITL